MGPLEIIGVPQSNYVWLVRMVCEEKRVPYHLVPARPHAPEVNAIHPLGKVPALRHGDVSLCESKAIATYIDLTFPGPRVIPQDPRAAAEVEQWVSLVNTAVDPVLMRRYFVSNQFPKTADGSPDRAAIDAALPEMSQLIAMLDRAVASTGHLAAGEYTLADMNLLPILYYVQRFPEGAEMVRAAADLSAYYARHAARPSFVATTPPPFAPRR